MGGEIPPRLHRGEPYDTAPIYTQINFQKGYIMARIKKMSTVANSGDRLEQLKNLSRILANQIDVCSEDSENGPKLMPQLSKQYRETIKEIEEIEGNGDADDEIDNILSRRQADGKPGAVR